MGIFENLRNEFIDIIEWIDSTNDTIAYRFERYNNEIKMGAQLTVRPGQKAVFVNEGQVADAFAPGRYELLTQNLPILSTLKGWKYGFKSPFKAEVYFFNTKIFADLKWGTPNAITIRDPELGPVRVRAHGTYSIRVNDPVQLLQQFVSTDGLFQVEEISNHIRNLIITGFSSWVGRAETSVFDFAANYTDFGNSIQSSLQPDMQNYGLELVKILVRDITLPPEVEQAIDRRNAMGLLGNMQQYAQYQAANAIEASAEKPSAGGGTSPLDFGVGLAMGQQIVNAFQTPAQNSPMQTSPTQPQPNQVASPPPPPPQIQWYLSRNGQNFGPFNANQLPQNGLAPDSFVWRNGMASWLPASQVPELSYLFSSPPPPPAGA
ncbi:MAG: SPFH domain-containing protein [Cyanobacteria bacterium P01_E01_bin.6]